MFDNLFSILGPVFSAAILVGVVATFAVFPLHRLGLHHRIVRKIRARE